MQRLYKKGNSDKKTINKFGPQSKNLASIIRGFKIWCHEISTPNPSRFCLATEPRDHDQIIRDQPAHGRIANYIQDTPMNWQDDELYVN